MVPWNPTVWLVSDRSDWVERIRAVVLGRFPSVAIVVCDWASVSRAPRGLPRLICWDLARSGSGCADVMSVYAELFYNYVSLVSISVPPDTREPVVSELIGLGYGRVVLGGEGASDAAAVFISEATGSALYLLPGVMRALDSGSRAVARAYALILADPSAVATVEGWGRLLGCRARRGIADLHMEAGIAVRPRTMLAYLRLLAAVDWACQRGGRHTAAEIARRFGYSSHKVPGRHAISVTGRSLGELLELGPEGMLALIPEIGLERRPAPQSDH